MIGEQIFCGEDSDPLPIRGDGRQHGQRPIPVTIAGLSWFGCGVLPSATREGTGQGRRRQQNECVNGAPPLPT